ncbi:hypothetical protein L6R44_15070 [Enterobacter cloacae complex sp. ECC445]|uniref:hypothetical protein n=1 Tax=Enterobacter cloacae complex TaxID=354276 RepID=UPI00097BCAE8|nr:MULTISPECIES: hypothetical protein [Enterobacter cloacae complex]GJL42769.1 hypothetical protein TUM17577_39780 [Enterobacter asburiae]MBT1935488.1 hypothetical protein [Enterobacter chengduensis]MBT1963928.1 hypothetical protein [Enterobacter chengduensis]MCG0457401.1 hypothetical protein [Enterobacter cloacae complex sp. ECC445]MCK6820246.1 hypothetical protein [Enterobacter chengduensis]
MSVKSQFLKKLQARQPVPVSFASKTQADIAEFRQRITQLQELMDAWLVDTGLTVEAFMASVTDLLVEGGAFDIAGIVLRVEDRAIKFMPLFLYGQGVTGCVEVTFHDGERMTPLGRLFMRSGIENDWTFAPSGALSRPGQSFDESTFYGLALVLLP